MTHSDQAELAARQCDAEISPLAATPDGTAADCDTKLPTLREYQASNQASFNTTREGILVTHRGGRTAGIGEFRLDEDVWEAFGYGVA